MNIRRTIRWPIVVALSMSVSAQAAPGYTTAANLSGINGRDVAFDMTIPGASNPMSCATPGLFRVAPSTINYNTIVTAVVTAYATGRKVSVYANSCDPGDGATLILAAGVSQ